MTCSGRSPPHSAARSVRFPGARYRVNRSHARAGPIAGSFPILSLRTNKADVICGVEQAVADRLDGTGEKWRYNGKWVHDSFMMLHGIFDRLPVSRVPGTPSCSSSHVRIREKYRREVLWCRMFYQHRCTIRPYTAPYTDRLLKFTPHLHPTRYLLLPLRRRHVRHPPHTDPRGPTGPL